MTKPKGRLVIDVVRNPTFRERGEEFSDKRIILKLRMFEGEEEFNKLVVKYGDRQESDAAMARGLSGTSNSGGYTGCDLYIKDAAALTEALDDISKHFAIDDGRGGVEKAASELFGSFAQRAEISKSKRAASAAL